MTSVAVVVPTFNRLSLLRQTVSSLQAQTLADSEFVLVDDRSDTETRDFLGSLPDSDSRFRIIEKSAEHVPGAQASRNLGLDAVASDALVFLDSDDLLADKCLAERYAALRAHPEADIVVGRQAIRDARSGQSWWVNVPSDARDDLDRFLAFGHPIDVPWVNGGIMIRTDRLRESGVRWRPEFHWDDVAFHFELLVNGLRPHWMSLGSAPDSYYIMHEEARYGSMLSTAEGLESAAAMIDWMGGILARAGKLNEGRRRALAFGFFNACFLPAIDSGQRQLAARMLNGMSIDVLANAERARLASYISGRAVLRFSPRATYYWNRLAAKALMPAFFSRTTSTYGTISTEITPDTGTA